MAQVYDLRQQYCCCSFAVVTYYPGMASVPRSNVLNFRGRSYTITADVEIPSSGAEGVLLALGGRFGGFSFFMQSDRLSYAYNWVGLERYTVTSREAAPAGSVKPRVEFTSAGPAAAQRHCLSTTSESAKAR